MGFFDRFKSSESNFEYLDKLIHSGEKEIILDSDIVLNRGEKSQYLRGIDLDVDNLVIDGKGHSIDAKGKTRIFYCNGKNITIKNIKLKNGFSEVGGAIFNDEGELVIIQSTFHDNASEEGGAIYNNGVLTITESTLAGNTAQGASYSHGGAIFNSEEGELVIIQSTFHDNTSKGGGAIHNLDKLSISESTFHNNTSREGGGAISNGGMLSISESIFQDNTSWGDGEESYMSGGGAIYNHWAELVIIQSTFQNNRSQKKGGAISNYCGTISISKSSFNYNTSQANGGVIHNAISPIGEPNQTVLSIFESTFHDNISHENGGTIYNSGMLSISGSTFHDNVSKVNGGIIYNNIGSLKVSDCEISNNTSSESIIYNIDYLEVFNSIFIYNKANNIINNELNQSNLGIFNVEFKDNDVDESIIFNNGKFCIIEKSSFKNLNSSKNIINYSNLTLNNSKIINEGKTILNMGYIFIKNESTHLLNQICGEGEIDVGTEVIPIEEKFGFEYLDKKIHESNTNEIILDKNICLEDYEIDYYEGGIELDIDNLIIDGNGKIIDGANKSRIFIITGNNITLKNIIFKNGHSHKNYDNHFNSNGGLIKINLKTNITIVNCEFINSISDRNGGAIYHSTGKLFISESVFKDNSSEWDGGAIYHSAGKLFISESVFEDNSSEESGGAIYHSNGEFSITYSELFENNAKSMGGAIFNDEDDLSICNSKLFKNRANGGGAIHNNNDGKLSIIQSILQENTAAVGGAIHGIGLLTKDSDIKNNYPNNVFPDHEGKYENKARKNNKFNIFKR